MTKQQMEQLEEEWSLLYRERKVHREALERIDKRMAELGDKFKEEG